jgi:hypothetical protein
MHCMASQRNSEESYKEKEIGEKRKWRGIKRKTCIVWLVEIRKKEMGKFLPSCQDE